MKKISFFIIVLVFFLVLQSVSHSKKLSPEEKFVRRKCTSCHTLPKKGKFDKGRLKSILKDHQNRIKLTEEEETNVIKFLLSTLFFSGLFDPFFCHFFLFSTGFQISYHRHYAFKVLCMVKTQYMGLSGSDK